MLSFTQILNLSISASFLVLAVALIRILLKNAPKAFHCCLWALVAFRLICPVSFESEMSLIPSREVIPEDYLYMEPVGHDAPAQLEIITNPVYDAPLTVDMDTTVDRLQSWDVMGTVIWLAGMGAMAIYALYSYLNLRFRVRMAGWVRGNIFECDGLDSPFILGILRPRIYLPSGLDEITRSHVLAHEHAHLKRLDHLWKPLGFVLLTAHWFNPVMWLAYILLCRDIELACDEKVIKNLDKPDVRAYSEALVRCSVSHRMIAVCPLAFGEVGVKGRIRSMLSYKKPGFWILLTAVIVSITLAVCFLTDPAEKPLTAQQIWEQDGFVITSSVEEPMVLTLYKDALPEDVLNGKEHTLEPKTVQLRRFDTTVLYAASARMSGDELLLEVTFDQRPEDVGGILLPFDPLDDSPDHFVHMISDDVKVDLYTYPDAATIRGKGREGFSLCVKADAFRDAEDRLTFQIGGIYHVTYAPAGDPLAQLLDKPLRVAEVRYSSPEAAASDETTFLINAFCSSLYLSQDMDHYDRLLESWIGALEEILLTEENFDRRFSDAGWTDADPCAELRQNNLAAWWIDPEYLSDKESILLLQKNGEIWLAHNAEPEGPFESLFRLTNEPAPPTAVVTADPYITTTWYYPAGMNDLTCPRFSLSTDSSFHLSASPISSYLGIGTYTQTDAELILKTDDDRCTWYFIPDGGGYRFDADRSSPNMICLDLKNLEPLPDGTLFLPSDSQKRAREGLDLAIQAVFEEYCKNDGDEQYLITECHNLLDAAIISGTPPVGTKEHQELVTVHAVGLVRRYTVRGTSWQYESQQLVHAAMTFLIEGNTYTLQTLKTGDDIPLADLYSPRAMELWLKYETEVGQLEDQCDWLAQLWVDQNPPTAEEVETLLETICTTPTQYSNPGAYIDTHPEEFARLIQCDRTTVSYCFEQFAAGNQMDLRGHIMMLACQSIIGQTEDFGVDAAYLTGQAWFNLFAEEADALREEIGSQELAKLHPYHAMALEVLGI